MTIIYLPPNSWLQKNVDESLSQLEAEGDYPQLGSFGDAAQLDNFSDKMWIKNTVKEQAPNSFISTVSVYGLYQVLERVSCLNAAAHDGYELPANSIPKSNSNAHSYVLCGPHSGK